MCGLASRWWISRSVKKPCRVAARLPFMRRAPSVLSAGGGQGEQFGDRGQVPVGVGRFGVAEEGRQHRQPAWTSTPSRYQPSKVETARACRKSCNLGRAPSGRASPAWRTSRANTNSTFCLISRVPAVEISRLGESCPQTRSLAQVGVVGQRGQGARMQRDLPALGELGVADRQDRYRCPGRIAVPGGSPRPAACR